MAVHFRGRVERQDLNVALPHPESQLAKLIVTCVVVGVMDNLPWLPDHHERGTPLVVVDLVMLCLGFRPVLRQEDRCKNGAWIELALDFHL